MRPNILIITLIIASLNTFAQNTPSFVPTNGLIGWWPFNGNANDESGNGNNGSINGAVLTTNRFGVPNNAFSFNGTSNYIDIANSSLAAFGTQSFTSLTWFKSNATMGNSFAGMFVRYDDCVSNSGWGIGFGANYDIYGLEFSTSRIPNTAFTTNSYNDNIWHLAVFVRDVSLMSNILYIDGNLISQTSFSSINQLFNTGSPLRFGSCGGFQFYQGELDDIGIWNRALTQMEISAYYQAQSCTGVNVITADGSTTICAGSNVKLSSSAVGTSYQWKRNGININGATSPSYSVTLGGSYTCAINCNGSISTSNAISVTWLENKSVTLSASGPTTFCTGDSVTLNISNPGTNYSIQWHRTNISMPGRNGNSLVVTQPGTYKVVTRNNTNGCSRISSSGITTVVNCSLVLPHGSTDKSTEVEQQFYREIKTEYSEGVSIYPNPNDGVFTFEYKGEESGIAKLQIFDFMGQEVYKKSTIVYDGILKEHIREPLKPGYYVMRMLLNGSLYDSRLLIGR